MRDYSGIVMNLRLLAADLETAYDSERGESLYSKAADAIEELLAKDTNVPDKNVGEWISVYDQLPDPGQKVLTLGPRGALDCGKFIGLSGTERTNWQDWHWQRFGTRKVRFWMPVDALPEPPKEDDE